MHIYKKKNKQSLQGLLGKYLLNICFTPNPSHLHWLTTWQTIEMFDLKMISSQLKVNISIITGFLSLRHSPDISHALGKCQDFSWVSRDIDNSRKEEALYPGLLSPGEWEAQSSSHPDAFLLESLLGRCVLNWPSLKLTWEKLKCKDGFGNKTVKEGQSQIRYFTMPMAWTRLQDRSLAHKSAASRYDQQHNSQCFLGLFACNNCHLLKHFLRTTYAKHCATLWK